MTGIIPTIGRIVLFRLSAHQADDINRRRKYGADSMDFHRWQKNGTMVHTGNSVSAGSIFPAVIVAVWGPTAESAVNLKVLLDGSDDYWATSVSVGPKDKDGAYHWMDYQTGQAAKTEALEAAAKSARSEPMPLA